MIRISNLQKKWEDGVIVLDDINLEIKKGDIYALVGRSGAGKSTLLRCINGLTNYQNGSIKVFGHEVKDYNDSDLRKFRRNIGMIFQHFSLLERISVYENIALPMCCWNYSKSEIDEKVTSLLKMVGLEDKANIRPRNLSGGQKQRVAIARALTMEPSILLCDEATSALDPRTADSILQLLLQINETMGITIIMVTHQMEVVQKICNKACILENGRIAAIGEVQELMLEEPDSLQRLLGEDRFVKDQNFHIVKFANFVDEPLEASFLTQMSIDLKIPFPILKGNISEYQRKHMAIFEIQVSNDDLDRVSNYLDSHNITWHEVSREGIRCH